MSGLDQAMSRLKKSPVSEPKPVPQLKKKVVESAPLLDDEPTEEEDDEETNEDLEDEEDEEIEEPEEIEQKPAPAKKIAQKPTQMVKVEEKPVEPSIEELQKQRAEEVQLLQNNGIFRVELLFQLGTLNKNLEDILKVIKG
jgi:hypothetical protein